MNGVPLLEVVDVHKHYRGVRALDGVSLAVMPGETLGMVGESGCGKSTVARLALGLERPTSGSLRFAGRTYPRSARRLRAIRRRVGIVFQDPYDSLDPRFTLRRIIDEPLRAHGLPHDRGRVEALLGAAGMENARLDSHPEEYSGGQRQRIGIARALALEPELLVCDEPTSALDVSVQAQILNLLLELQREHGLAYLFISHDLEVVRRMSDRLAVIYAGRIVETGPAAEVTAAPRHPYTRALMDAVPAARPAERRAIGDAGARGVGGGGVDGLDAGGHSASGRGATRARPMRSRSPARGRPHVRSRRAARVAPMCARPRCQRCAPTASGWSPAITPWRGRRRHRRQSRPARWVRVVALRRCADDPFSGEKHDIHCGGVIACHVLDAERPSCDNEHAVGHARQVSDAGAPTDLGR